MRSDRLNAVFSALADPTRRAILARLATGAANVMELAQPFDMSQPSVSKHLRVLEHAGLIVRGRDAQRRPCRLEPAPLKAVAEFVERYRQHWEQSFDRLELHLQRMKTDEALKPKGKPRRGQKHTLATNDSRFTK
ncbi:MAG TPA: metalloregulator ArsR/SmtB family transcription factor [Steroidobacteraceae bacterium]|jgi:DNA-binding transcriptional ArsR family regulator|nr:metalloregulator ArsR/SmtB family transcription factor [Steroidobacteraceae bacterium]